MQGIPRGIRCAVYDKVVANPTITNIEEARTLYLESGTKAIIAFGGGSAMDCAKVTGACIVKPNKPIHKMKIAAHLQEITSAHRCTHYSRYRQRDNVGGSHHRQRRKA